MRNVAAIPANREACWRMSMMQMGDAWRQSALLRQAMLNEFDLNIYDDIEVDLLAGAIRRRFGSAGDVPRYAWPRLYEPLHAA